MKIFKNYTEEMFKEDNSKNKISKKHYKLFINDLITNLPNVLNLEKLQPKNEIYAVSIMLNEILHGDLRHSAFEGLEINSLLLYLGYSNSLEEVENKILNKFSKEYELKNLRICMSIEDIKSKYQEKYKILIQMVEEIKKHKKVTLSCKYKNIPEEIVYFRNPRKGHLSFSHIVYELIEEFVHQKFDSNYKTTYDLDLLIADNGNIIYNGKFE